MTVIFLIQLIIHLFPRIVSKPYRTVSYSNFEDQFLNNYSTEIKSKIIFNLSFRRIYSILVKEWIFNLSFCRRVLRNCSSKFDYGRLRYGMKKPLYEYMFYFSLLEFYDFKVRKILVNLRLNLHGQHLPK